MEGCAALRFTMPYPPGKKKSAFVRRFGLNAYYTGKHWTQRKRDAEEWHEAVLWELKSQHIPKVPFTRAVEITFRWDDGLDADNHAVMGKFIVDALRGYLLQNDSRRYVKSVRHTFWEQGSIGVEITEAEQ